MKKILTFFFAFFFVFTSFAYAGVLFQGEYYDGIENNPQDFGVYGIQNVQDSSGAFGYRSNFQRKDTFYVVRALQDLGYDNAFSPLQNGINFLKTSPAPKTRNESLYYLMGKKWSGLDIQSEIDVLLIDQNEDGGFGIQKGYESDVFSSLSVLFLLYEQGGYEMQKQTVETYILANINPLGVSYNTTSSPNIYLNAFALDSLRNAPESNLIKRKAKAFLEGLYTSQNLYEKEDLEGLAYALWIGQKLYGTQEYSTPYTQEDLIYWQDDSGLIDGNISTTAFALPFIFSNGGCIPPASGDWTITESCTFEGSATAYGDIIIEPNAVLIISATSELYMDFKNHKLLVKKEGGVLVKQGGKLAQSQ